MPQEINKENVTAQVLYKIGLTRRAIKGFVDTKASLRTDAQRIKQQGIIEGLTLSLGQWVSTAELFGIEINIKDDE